MGWGRGVKRKEELSPENSVFIKPLLHLLIASHWGCREISVACHYACRCDFSFIQLAYHCTIWTVLVWVFKATPSWFCFFLLLSVLHTSVESCHSYWESKNGVQADKNVPLLVVRHVNKVCVCVCACLCVCVCVCVCVGRCDASFSPYSAPYSAL